MRCFALILSRIFLASPLSVFCFESIIHCTPGQFLEELYLEEILELATTKEVKLLEKNLLACPLILDGYVKSRDSNLLEVGYVLRRPFCLLEGVKNRAIDQEGIIFPVAPVFSPKKLPKIRFWRAPEEISLKERQEKIKELLLIMEETEPRSLELILADFSKIEAPSLGKREVVFHFRYMGKYDHYIRMRKGDCLERYLVVIDEEYPMEKDLLIDLRIAKTLLLGAPS